MNTEYLYNKIRAEFQHEPTPEQEKLLRVLPRFIYFTENEALFLLRGYAGTGKTSVISALIRALKSVYMKSVLMAPTGRAAKVLASYSGQRAHTIHQKIYFIYTLKSGVVSLRLQKNKHKNTIFIIDEASMISEGSGEGIFTDHNLLHDMMEYIYSGENCRAILIGDVAQLPPVGLNISPALDLDYLRAAFDFTPGMLNLKQVVRQAADSGILSNATRLRIKLEQDDFAPPFFDIDGFRDIESITGRELGEELASSYAQYGEENAIIISYSNKRANFYNREIRNRILFRDDEICAGDMLMIVRNNYYWLPEDSKAGFLANGEMAEVLQVLGRDEKFGFRFADVMLRLTDYPDEPEIEVKIMLDTLMIDSASLPQEQNNAFFDAACAHYADRGPRQKVVQAVKEDPHFNALQVKFAYAMTCHKTQGGQWKHVYLDPGYITEERLNREYLRWLYTAVTRATEKLFLVNFNEWFFGGPSTPLGDL